MTKRTLWIVLGSVMLTGVVAVGAIIAANYGVDYTLYAVRP